MGCGSSGGVPRLGPSWGACDPSEPKNRRRRAAVLIQRFSEAGRTSVLVDASPDLREQLLDEKISWLDGVVFTHDHADHTHGIDDLRMIAFHGRRRVDVYFDAATRQSLTTRFDYCFRAASAAYAAILEPHEIRPYEPIVIDGKGGPIEILPFAQEHGDGTSLGLRVGRIAYSSDASGFPSRSLPCLQGLDVWIVGALRYVPHPSHFTVKQALTWIGRQRPKRAILTHLHIDLDYATLKRELPERVEPAYDGLRIDAAD
jgi:phosphoribosyl 1,2-cyclic phosphate phosphodiesterase